MKRLFLIILLVMSGITIIRAQGEPTGGEMNIYFEVVPLPVAWQVEVLILAIGAYWDQDHYLSDEYPGGLRYYWDGEPPYNKHFSSACWYSDVFIPVLGLGLYKIKLTYDEDSVSFYIDWRTSDLPPEFNEWDDQLYEYNLRDNKIYRRDDQNQISIDGQVLNIWDEIEDIDRVTSGFELYLTVSNQNNNPYLEWNAYHDPNILGYKVYRKITTSSGTTTEVETTTNTYYLDEEFYIDPPKTPGDDEVEYWIKAEISSTEESLEGNHVRIVGTSIIQWKISDKGSNNDLYYNLSQNYPNPFNPLTTIEFTLKEKSLVSLRVFDILGREVKTIINERLEAGIHQVEFDGGNLESGVYFYEFQANNFRDVKKLILLK